MTHGRDTKCLQVSLKFYLARRTGQVMTVTIIIT